MKKILLLASLILVIAGFCAVSCQKKTEVVTPKQITEVIKEIENDKNFDWEAIGLKIWFNEDQRRERNGLASWNAGEDVISIGIGHFIWANENTVTNYEESFPELIKFIQREYPKVYIPEWLTLKKFPWSERESFQRDKRFKNVLIEQLLDFCEGTISEQTDFFVYKFKNNITNIAALSNNPRKTEATILSMLNDDRNVYPLVDYLSFKGPGTNPGESVNGYRWGLLQVLENMGDNSLEAFVKSAKFVLNRRVDNDPDTKQWQRGWMNRLDTYLN